MAAHAKTRRAFIGFFGITRALEHTIASIETNIYAPLQDAGLEMVRAAHFNRPDVIHAPRDGETQVPFSMADLTRLRLDRHVIEPQSIETIAAPLAIVNRLPWKAEPDEGGTIRRNATFQLHSLSRLGRLFREMEPDSYDLVLLLRPDLRYLDPLPVQQLLAQLGRTTGPTATVRRHVRPPADIVIPSWQDWEGLNDRFAIATPAAAHVYLSRIDSLAAYCAGHPWFQTEAFLKFVLSQAQISVARTWMRAERVRADGSVAHRDRPRRRDRWRIAAIHPLRRALHV